MPLFPPREEQRRAGWRYKGNAKIDHLTSNGTIQIEREIYRQSSRGRDDRIDRWLGLSDGSVSVEARELCCRIVLPGGSFSKAAENLLRIGQIRVSDERLRQITEREGGSVLEASRLAILKPAWAASDCKVEPNGPTRVMVGSDGVMVPVITESEKRKRRENVRRRGKARLRRIGIKKAKRRRIKGSDLGYKEFKIVAFYDQSRRRQHVVGTCGDHKVLGRLARREACRLNLSDADEKLSLTDGAEWIFRQLTVHIPILDAMILDFYHMAEHVAQAARICFGETGDTTERWVHQMLTTAKEQGPAAVLACLHETRKTVRSATKRTALNKLEQYIVKRTAMMDYPDFLKKGFDIGSGPTEAFCKTLTARLKGSGMRWNVRNAEAVMALAALEQSGQWKSYWKLQCRSAA